MKKQVLLLLLIFLAQALWGQDKPVGSAGIGVMYSNDFAAEINGRNTPVFNLGIFVYGDFIYLQVISGLFYGTADNSRLNYLGAELGLFGKFPFMIIPGIFLFPLLGFEFEGALVAVYDNMFFKNRHIKWNQFWFKAGAGLDYVIKEKVHLRLEGLYGIRLRSGAGNTLENETRLVFNDNLGHSFTVRMAVGL